MRRAQQRPFARPLHLALQRRELLLRRSENRGALREIVDGDSSEPSREEVAAERGAVRLIEGFGPPEPVVTADPVRLRQCLDNLIGNACKYGVRGGYVRVDLNEEDGRTAIHVSDNGPGIGEEALARLKGDV